MGREERGSLVSVLPSKSMMGLESLWKNSVFVALTESTAAEGGDGVRRAACGARARLKRTGLGTISRARGTTGRTLAMSLSLSVGG